MDGLTGRESEDIERLRGEPPDEDDDAGAGSVLGPEDADTRVAPTDPLPDDIERELAEDESAGA